jgi:phenylpyruvate tautomerase
MPMLNLQTSAEVSEQQKSDLLPRLSKILGETLGKPEQYVMVTIGQCSAIMAGKPGPAAFVDIRSIGGLGGPANKKLSEQVCAALYSVLGIAADRVYFNFTNVAAKDWGWNGSTFG